MKYFYSLNLLFKIRANTCPMKPDPIKRIFAFLDKFLGILSIMLKATAVGSIKEQIL